MNIDILSFIESLSGALDELENNIIPTRKDHSKRIAYFACFIGSELGLNPMDLMDLSILAFVHDNGYAQYNYEESKNHIKDDKLHCIYGEKNITRFPLKHIHLNSILYHHENYDGSGYFHKKGEDIPLFSQLLRFSDLIEEKGFFIPSSTYEYAFFVDSLKKMRNKEVSKKIIGLFLKKMTETNFYLLQHSSSDLLFRGISKQMEEKMLFQTVRNVVNIYANLIDYALNNFKFHSLNVAQKAFRMGRFYHLSSLDCELLYIAGSLYHINEIFTLNNNLDCIEKIKLINEQNEIMFSNLDGFQKLVEWLKRPTTINPLFATEESSNYCFENRLLVVLDAYQNLLDSTSKSSIIDNSFVKQSMEQIALQKEVDEKITRDVLKYPFSKKLSI